MVVLSACGGSDSDDEPVETAPSTTEADGEPGDDFTPAEGEDDTPLGTATATDATDTTLADSTATTEAVADSVAATDTEPITSSASTEGAADVDAIAVSMVEWEIDAPTEYAAGDVTFTATNNGNFPHEFVVIAGDGYESLPLADGGAVIEDELPPNALLGRTDRVSGGESADLAVTLEPGNYVLLCNLGGGSNSHAGRGQTLDITVS